MAKPLLTKLLVSSACMSLITAPLARGEEKPTQPAPSVAVADDREPASVGEREVEDPASEFPLESTTKKIMAEEKAMFDKAARDTVERFNKFKSATEVVEEFKKNLGTEDQKVLNDYAANAKLNEPFKFSYTNGKFQIRIPNGKVVSFYYENLAEYKLIVEGMQVSLAPSIPLKERLHNIENALKPKFSAGRFDRLDLMFPRAEAVHPALIAAGVVAGATILTGITAWASRDSFAADFLERNQKVIYQAREKCENFLDHKTKEVTKVYRVKKRNRRHGDRQTYTYKDVWVDRTIELSPDAIYKEEMKELRLRLGDRPDDTTANQDKIREWDAAASEIEERLQQAKLSRGHQRLKKDTFCWADALSERMCRGKFSAGQSVTPKNLSVDIEGDNEDDAEDVLSYYSLCTKTKELLICFEDLSRKRRLSAAGNQALLKIMQGAQIGSAYLAKCGARKPRKRTTDTVD